MAPPACAAVISAEPTHGGPTQLGLQATNPRGSDQQIKAVRFERGLMLLRRQSRRRRSIHPRIAVVPKARASNKRQAAHCACEFVLRLVRAYGSKQAKSQNPSRA